MKIPTDKLLHFLCGAAIAALFSPFGLLASMTAVGVIAIGKEVRDSFGYGTADPLDAFATVAGGFFLLIWFEFAARYIS